MSEQIANLGGSEELVSYARDANSALDILNQCNKEALPISRHICQLAQGKALAMLKGTEIRLNIIAIARNGDLLWQTPFMSNDDIAIEMSSEAPE